MNIGFVGLHLGLHHFPVAAKVHARVFQLVRRLSFVVRPALVGANPGPCGLITELQDGQVFTAQCGLRLPGKCVLEPQHEAACLLKLQGTWHGLGHCRLQLFRVTVLVLFNLSLIFQDGLLKLLCHLGNGFRLRVGELLLEQCRDCLQRLADHFRRACQRVECLNFGCTLNTRQFTGRWRLHLRHRLRHRLWLLWQVCLGRFRVNLALLLCPLCTLPINPFLDGIYSSNVRFGTIAYAVRADLAL